MSGETDFLGNPGLHDSIYMPVASYIPTGQPLNFPGRAGISSVTLIRLFYHKVNDWVASVGLNLAL